MKLTDEYNKTCYSGDEVFRYLQKHDCLHVSYVQVPFFGFRRNFYAQTNSFTDIPGFMPYLTRASPISSSSLSTYHSASVSSRQLGNLTTTFETIADLDSIDGEATKREDI